MLEKLFENLILFVINCNRNGADRPGRAGLAGGILGRLLGRHGIPPQAAKQDDAPADPPMVIGDVIPSPRDAMRHASPAGREVSLSTGERLRQILINGGTGAGKSTLLLNMIDADVAAGRGVGFIDYRGDMADRLLVHLAARYAPEELAERLLLIDLRASPGAAGGADYTVGFDALAQGGDAYSQAMFVVDVLRQQFGGSLGCQTEELLRNVLLAMALSPLPAPLADIELFLASDAALAALLDGVEDRNVLRFFHGYRMLPEAQRAGQWVSPVRNKFAPMLCLPQIRRCLGDARSVPLRDFLDSRPDPILVVALAADEIHGAADLVGTLVVNAVAAAIMRSGRQAPGPFFLTLDEFQNLANGGAADRFAMMVSESRRFGLGLNLSNQSTTQLNPGLRVLIRNVAANHVLFSTGGADADLLAGEIPSDEPKAVMKQVLLSQKAGEAVLVRRGLPTTRIKTRYEPDPDVPAAAVQALRLASLCRHGRPAADVDREMREREERYLSPAAPPPGTQTQSATRQAGTRPGSPAQPKSYPRSQKTPPAASAGANPDAIEVRDYGD